MLCTPASPMHASPAAPQNTRACLATLQHVWTAACTDPGLQVVADIVIALLLPAANTDKDSNAADQASSVGDDAAPGSPSNASSAAGDAEGAQLHKHTCCAPCAVACMLLVLLPLALSLLCICPRQHPIAAGFTASASGTFLLSWLCLYTAHTWPL